MERIQAAFEGEALALARVIFSEYADIFAQLSLRVDGPEVVRADLSSKDSELRVYFWGSEHNIVDAFEFFLVEGGEPALSKEDLERWLRETLDDVVRRRREAMVK